MFSFLFFLIKGEENTEIRAKNNKNNEEPNKKMLITSQQGNLIVSFLVFGSGAGTIYFFIFRPQEKEEEKKKEEKKKEEQKKEEQKKEEESKIFINDPNSKTQVTYDPNSQNAIEKETKRLIKEQKDSVAQQKNQQNATQQKQKDEQDAIKQQQQKQQQQQQQQQDAIKKQQQQDQLKKQQQQQQETNFKDNQSKLLKIFQTPKDLNNITSIFNQNTHNYIKGKITKNNRDNVPDLYGDFFDLDQKNKTNYIDTLADFYTNVVKIINNNKDSSKKRYQMTIDNTIKEFEFYVDGKTERCSEIADVLKHNNLKVLLLFLCEGREFTITNGVKVGLIDIVEYILRSTLARYMMIDPLGDDFKKNSPNSNIDDYFHDLFDMTQNPMKIIDKLHKIHGNDFSIDFFFKNFAKQYEFFEGVESEFVDVCRDLIDKNIKTALPELIKVNAKKTLLNNEDRTFLGEIIKSMKTQISQDIKDHIDGTKKLDQTTLTKEINKINNQLQSNYVTEIKNYIDDKKQKKQKAFLQLIIDNKNNNTKLLEINTLTKHLDIDKNTLDKYEFLKDCFVKFTNSINGRLEYPFIAKGLSPNAPETKNKKQTFFVLNKEKIEAPFLGFDDMTQRFDESIQSLLNNGCVVNDPINLLEQIWNFDLKTNDCKQMILDKNSFTYHKVRSQKNNIIGDLYIDNTQKDPHQNIPANMYRWLYPLLPILKNKDQASFVVNIGDGHYVTLFIKKENKELKISFIDSMSGCSTDGNILDVLKDKCNFFDCNKTAINNQSLRVQEDGVNCGLFAAISTSALKHGIPSEKLTDFFHYFFYECNQDTTKPILEIFYDVIKSFTNQQKSVTQDVKQEVFTRLRQEIFFLEILLSFATTPLGRENTLDILTKATNKIYQFSLQKQNFYNAYNFFQEYFKDILTKDANIKKEIDKKIVQDIIDIEL